MELIPKEPEKIVREKPKFNNLEFSFYIDNCPHPFTIGSYFNDAVFVQTLQNLFTVSENIVTKNSAQMCYMIPDKSKELLYIITSNMKLCIGEMFTRVVNLQTARIDETNQNKKIWLQISANGKALALAFDSIHNEDINKLGRVYQAACMRVNKDGTHTYIGPKTEESKLNNACNRFTDVMVKYMKIMVETCHKIYRG